MTNVTLSAKVIGVTQPVVDYIENGAEGIVAHCARVSSGRPLEDRSTDHEKLLQYCVRNKHWSIFQMANILVRVDGPRDITRQLLRHSSMVHLDPHDYGLDYTAGGVQEFSQRYSDQIEFTGRDFRKQDNKNRQNSLDKFDPAEKEYLKGKVEDLKTNVQDIYKLFRSDEWDVAKECVRVILPEGLTMSTLYTNVTVRSWLTYLDVRDDPGVTQWEHVLMAREIKKAIAPYLPSLINNDKENNV